MAAGPGGPAGKGRRCSRFDSLAANLGNESLELTGLTLEALGITMAGSLSGQKLLSDLQLSGAVDIREFNPRDVLAALKVELDDGRLGRSAPSERESESPLYVAPGRLARHAARARRLDPHGPRGPRRREARLRSHDRRHQHRPVLAARDGGRCAGRRRLARRGGFAARRAAHAQRVRRAQVRPSEVQRPHAHERRIRAHRGERRAASHAERAALRRQLRRRTSPSTCRRTPRA